MIVVDQKLQFQVTFTRQWGGYILEGYVTDAERARRTKTLGAEMNDCVLCFVLMHRIRFG